VDWYFLDGGCCTSWSAVNAMHTTKSITAAALADLFGVTTRTSPILARRARLRAGGKRGRAARSHPLRGPGRRDRAGPYRTWITSGGRSHVRQAVMRQAKLRLLGPSPLTMTNSVLRTGIHSAGKTVCRPLERPSADVADARARVDPDQRKPARSGLVLVKVSDEQKAGCT
jgi:hypothetical protein